MSCGSSATSNQKRWRAGSNFVDGLKTSEYLQETARRNIEGEITIDEARQLVKEYYIKEMEKSLQ